MNVFVYGANLLGIHGAGSAKEAALNHGAIRGKTGRQGASYGIPTKRTPWAKMPLHEIEMHVRDFLAHADSCPGDTFNSVEIACGRAGYTPRQIAPMFAGAPENVLLPESFRAVLERASDAYTGGCRQRP